MGMLIFAGVAYSLHKDAVQAEVEATVDTQQYLILVCVVALVGVVTSTFVSANIVKNARQEHDLWAKLLRYKNAQIIKYALIEGPTLFAIVIYMSTAHINFLAIAALLIGIFVVNVPTKAKLIKDLQLSDAETKTLDNSEELI